MRQSARPEASELVAETAQLARQRQRLERVLVAAGPSLVAVATVAASLLPAWIAALAAAAALVWAAVGIGASDESEERAARRLDRGLDTKETFLTWATVPDAARGPLWPVVAERARQAATGLRPRPFVDPFGWRRPLLSFGASLAAMALLFLVVALRPEPAVPPLTALERIADSLSAPGRDAASLALGAELRELAKQLADPERSAEEKRDLAVEMKKKLEQQKQRSQQGQQGKQGGKGEQQQKSAGESAAGAEGDSQGEGHGSGAEKQAAANALGQIEKDLAGESKGERKSGEEKGEQQSRGGGVKGPSEGKRAGEKPGEGTGSEPGPKEDGGKSEEGEGEGGRRSGEKPEGEQGEQQSAEQLQREGGAKGEGAGAAGKPSTAEEGQKAERYYQLGEGPDALRVEDGRYVRVLVPEQGGGAGTERVQKPGEVSIETPFGNAPLPSEGAPGEADERQPLPLEYWPILGIGPTEGSR